VLTKPLAVALRLSEAWPRDPLPCWIRGRWWLRLWPA